MSSRRERLRRSALGTVESTMLAQVAQPLCLRKMQNHQQHAFSTADREPTPDAGFHITLRITAKTPTRQLQN